VKFQNSCAKFQPWARAPHQKTCKIKILRRRETVESAFKLLPSPSFPLGYRRPPPALPADTARRSSSTAFAADDPLTAVAILPKSTKFGIFHRQWTSQLPRIGFATFVWGKWARACLISTDKKLQISSIMLRRRQCFDFEPASMFCYFLTTLYLLGGDLLRLVILEYTRPFRMPNSGLGTDCAWPWHGLKLK